MTPRQANAQVTFYALSPALQGCPTRYPWLLQSQRQRVRNHAETLAGQGIRQKNGRKRAKGFLPFSLSPANCLNPATIKRTARIRDSVKRLCRDHARYPIAPAKSLVRFVNPSHRRRYAASRHQPGRFFTAGRDEPTFHCSIAFAKLRLCRNPGRDCQTERAFRPPAATSRFANAVSQALNPEGDAASDPSQSATASATTSHPGCPSRK